MTMLATMHSHRAAIQARDAATERRLAALYRSALAPIARDVDALTAKMADWQRQHPGEQLPASWLHEDARLHRLQLLMQEQVDGYSGDVRGIVAQDTAAAAHLGAGDGLSLLEASLPRGQEWTWGRPSTNALDALGKEPFSQLFAGWGRRASQTAQRILFADIALGRNPRAIASDLLSALAGMTYSRALTIARTSAIRAYSDGAMATYRANSDVCDGWVWVADLSVNTCAACLALNGSEHALDEDLYDHPNGRCAKLPKTKSWADLLGGFGIDTSDIPDTTASVPSGASWFDGLSAADQRSVLGPSKYDAFNSGNLSLSDLIGYDDDPLWGRSITEKPLKDAV